MKKMYVTATIQNELESRNAFYILFHSTILNLVDVVMRVGKSNYCLFIDFAPTQSGTHVKIHDGGATYNDEVGDMETLIYFERNSIAQASQPYKLYYSTEENILCFLNER